MVSCPVILVLASQNQEGQRDWPTSVSRLMGELHVPVENSLKRNWGLARWRKG